MPTSVTITRHPFFGFATVDPTTGIISYTPLTNFDGADSLRYTITDSRGGISTPGQVTITILDLPEPYYNGLDVNADGAISPIDAVLVINQLNSAGVGVLAPPVGDVEFFYDTDGDNVLAPIDALLVINFLNATGAGQGESSVPNSMNVPIPTITPAPRMWTTGADLNVDDLLLAWIMASDQEDKKASAISSDNECEQR